MVRILLADAAVLVFVVIIAGAWGYETRDWKDHLTVEEFAELVCGEQDPGKVRPLVSQGAEPTWGKVADSFERTHRFWSGKAPPPDLSSFHDLLVLQYGFMLDIAQRHPGEEQFDVDAFLLPQWDETEPYYQRMQRVRRPKETPPEVAEVLRAHGCDIGEDG